MSLKLKSLKLRKFYGPRSSMVSPWSTNAVEITRIMGIEKILRIEEFLVFTVVKVLIQCYLQNTQNLIKIFLKIA